MNGTAEHAGYYDVNFPYKNFLGVFLPPQVLGGGVVSPAIRPAPPYSDFSKKW